MFFLTQIYRFRVWVFHGFPYRSGRNGMMLPRKSRVILPSGEHTKSNGKSPFLMGKSTINDLTTGELT